MVKVSVIIPIYGVEKYIERCVRSLFEQTLVGVEYIFVNDCTPDNSIIILQSLIDEYREQLEVEGKSYKIINLPQNGGLPHARWCGIQEASGQYIAHCDSDDWVDKDMYRKLYEEAVLNDSDMIICDYYSSKGVNSVPITAFKDGLDKEEIYKLMFDHKIPWNVWNKIVRAEYYKEKSFVVPEQTQGEDMAFTLQLLYFVKKIKYVHMPLYYYQEGSVTVTHSQDEKAILKRYNAAVDNVKKIELFFQDKQYNDIISNGILTLKMTSRDLLLPLLDNNLYYKMWLNTFPEINKQILGNKGIRLKFKIKYLLLKFHMNNKVFKFV